MSTRVDTASLIPGATVVGHRGLGVGAASVLCPVYISEVTPANIRGRLSSVQQIMIITGLTLAFGDTSGGFRKLIQIVFGLSIAFAASSFFLSFFSFSGGAVV